MSPEMVQQVELIHGYNGLDGREYVSSASFLKVCYRLFWKKSKGCSAVAGTLNCSTFSYSLLEWSLRASVSFFVFNIFLASLFFCFFARILPLTAIFFFFFLGMWGSGESIKAAFHNNGAATSFGCTAPV